MILINKKLWFIGLLAISTILSCKDSAKNNDDIIAYLNSLQNNSSAIASPFTGKVSSQFKPMPQNNAWTTLFNLPTNQPITSPFAKSEAQELTSLPTPQKSDKFQETKLSNGSKNIDYFDPSGKNICRIELDARGAITSFINFYNDGRQSKTTYHQDKTQTISYFGTDLKHTKTIKLDQYGKTTEITISKPDGSATQTTYNSDGSQTIISFNPQGKSNQRTKVEPAGNVIELLEFHDNNTQTKTTYNSDKTQTITTFGADHKSTSITEINAHGKPTKMVEFHPDTTQSITTYDQDGSHSTDHRDLQGKRISLTRVQANGSKVHASAKLITAWHEAAHAISHTHNDTLSLINYITIKPQDRVSSITGQTIQTQGHVQASRRVTKNQTIEEIDNKIMTAICGAVGEQMLMRDAMLDNPQEILELLAQPPYTDDMLQARHDAKEILRMNGAANNQNHLDDKINEILIRLYKQSYQFIAQHRSEVQKIADHLMEKETIHTQEAYKLLNLKQPWALSTIAA